MKLAEPNHELTTSISKIDTQKNQMLNALHGLKEEKIGICVGKEVEEFTKMLSHHSASNGLIEDSWF